MLRTYGTLVLAVVFFAAVPSALRAQPEGKKEEPNLGALNKQLDDAARKLDEATRKLDLATQRIAQLEDQVKSLQFTRDLANEIRAKMAELDKTLGKLSMRVDNNDTFLLPRDQARTSRKPGDTPGRVLMANHYVDDLTFYINEKRYVVPAQSTVLVENVPPGPFSYKVVHARFGERLNPDAIMAPGQTFTLSAK